MAQQNFKTFTLHFFYSLFLFALFLPNKASAQDAPTMYYAIQYMKVPLENDNEYIRLETEVWKILHQARKDAGLLDGWYLFRVLSPAGTDTEYNYVTVNAYSSLEKLAGHYESFGVDYTKLLNSEQISIALKTDKIRDLVKEEVWKLEDREPLENLDKMYRYQVVNSMRLKPGVTGNEYSEVEKNYWKPIHQARIKGGNMYGWGLYSLVMPGGTSASYTWGTADFYSNFTDMFYDYSALFSKIHKGKDIDKMFEKTDNTRDLLSSEVRLLIDYVQ
jgi:hypothetical protein